MTTTTPYPPLESGDRLSRDEFHRRYELRPDIKRAELIDGVVYVSSPDRWAQHDRQQGLISLWLQTYAAETPGVEVGSTPTIFLPVDQEVQPDGVLFRIGALDAGVTVRDDGYLEGAPELIVEVGGSTARHDLHTKLDAYRRAGVREYIVWRTLEQRIDWFRLEDGNFVPMPIEAGGVIESRAFPGLRLDVAAMLRGDRAAVLKALRRPRRRKG